MFTIENEGYRILKAEQYNEDKMLVLGKLNESNFVVWRYSWKYNDFYWGHYFNTHTQALIWFHNLMAELLEQELL